MGYLPLFFLIFWYYFQFVKLSLTMIWSVYLRLHETVAIVGYCEMIYWPGGFVHGFACYSGHGSQRHGTHHAL